MAIDRVMQLRVEQFGASMGILVQNGTVVTADRVEKADVLMEGSTIREVRADIDPDGHTVVDAAGLFVLPGGIDAHTHMDMPFGGTVSADDFLTGTRAAAIGGTTTIVDFAIQAKGTRMRDALDIWRSKAEGKACVDYGLHMIVTDLGSDNGKQGMHDMDDMVREGVDSFKLFMAYPNVLMVDDGTIFKALRQTAKNGALVCMHAENGSAIDVIVQQALAEGKKAPKYHALTRPTTAEAEAVGRGLPVYAETCPQYLYLSLENMDAPGFEGAKYVFTPPLREKWNQEKLWQGLAKDTLQVVSTDHCPFCFKEQKELGKDDFTKIPNGGPGIEHRLSLVYTGGVHGKHFSPNRFVQLVATAPAKLFGLYPRKGTIAVGSDADLVIFDPNHEEVISAKTHHMRVDYSMFEGIRIKGAPKTVFCRGRAVIAAGKFVGSPGSGQFLRRQTYAGL